MTAAAVLPDPGPGTASPAVSGPVAGPVGAARAPVSEALESGVWSRSDSDLVDDLGQTLALRAQAEALLLTQIAEVDSRGLARQRGCPSTRAWLRSAHRISPGEASRLVTTGKTLRDQLPAVGAALAAGTMSSAQAQVCVEAIADLPAQTPVAKRPQAEATMIDAAASFDPVILARIGRRLAEIIDPEGVQARDEQPITDNEDDAYRDRDLTLTPSASGAGGTLRARLDAVAYAMLSAYLNAATAPRTSPDGGTNGSTDSSAEADPAQGPAGAAAAGDTRTYGQRRHDALTEAIRQVLHAGGLPCSGGVKPRVIVTIPYDCLRDRTGAGRTADGTQLSPTLTRQLADDAELIPVWLSPTGEPLDVGRGQRLYAARIRTALDVRDRGCAWPGCDRPPSWCQSHHIVAWIDGGRTDLDNGVLLCLFHHHEIDKGDWTVAIRGGRAGSPHPAGSTTSRNPSSTSCTTHHPANS